MVQSQYILLVRAGKGGISALPSLEAPRGKKKNEGRVTTENKSVRNDHPGSRDAVANF